MNAAKEQHRLLRGHVPGEAGLWVLIFGDLIVFAVLFVTYVVARAGDLPAMQLSQAKLDRGLGLANTVLLLTSSWCIAHAVIAARNGTPHVRRLIVAAMALGLAFVGVKVVEWSSHIGHGDTLNSASFFTYYYMYTGIHLLHVVIGLGVLIWMALRCGPDGRWKGSIATLEGSAVFWHLVDLLWVMIFAIIYLLR